MHHFMRTCFLFIASFHAPFMSSMEMGKVIILEDCMKKIICFLYYPVQETTDPQNAIAQYFLFFNSFCLQNNNHCMRDLFGFMYSCKKIKNAWQGDIDTIPILFALENRWAHAYENALKNHTQNNNIRSPLFPFIERILTDGPQSNSIIFSAYTKIVHPRLRGTHPTHFTVCIKITKEKITPEVDDTLYHYFLSDNAEAILNFLQMHFKKEEDRTKIVSTHNFLHYLKKKQFTGYRTKNAYTFIFSEVNIKEFTFERLQQLIME